MNLNQIQERINKLFSLFVTEVRGATAMGRTDINRVSEVVLIPLLSKVFDLSNLANLNHTEQTNYPGIDLGDSVARIAFQVTSTSSSEKVKETLTKFVNHELYKQYDRLIIYNLTEKQGSYSAKGFDEIIQGKFGFDKDQDIIDYRDVLKVISSFQVDKAQEILHTLETNFVGDFSLFDTPERIARREELLGKYFRLFKERISKIRILGDPSLHDLNDVFVELTVLKERERPSSRTRMEYWEVMDAALRERRDPRAGFWRSGNQQTREASRKARPEELLKTGMRAVVAGSPGSGKSTLLKYLALKSLGDEDYLPVFLELNKVREDDFTAAGGNLAELVFSKALAETVCETEFDRALLRVEFNKKLDAGRVSIFLDGLDEVSGTRFFDELRQTVKEFLRHDDY
jgi:hypothetical protein